MASPKKKHLAKGPNLPIIYNFQASLDKDVKMLLHMHAYIFKSVLFLSTYCLKVSQEFVIVLALH